MEITLKWFDDDGRSITLSFNDLPDNPERGWLFSWKAIHSLFMTAYDYCHRYPVYVATIAERDYLEALWVAYEGGAPLDIVASAERFPEVAALWNQIGTL